ncbi:hypothetical protein Moror_10727 [Moniliophthora roreri MCA 2997]|uniref:Uncharacterized protein n=1 Tax=Moniliophthora roreri (strain MCA 2997) TaxID=1381753 RepID=V2X6J9_MONRO|nr:hypothetical protein Moror_10727 [Moniliophthora roreri MCA 2997]
MAMREIVIVKNVFALKTMHHLWLDQATTSVHTAHCVSEANIYCQVHQGSMQSYALMCVSHRSTTSRFMTGFVISQSQYLYQRRLFMKWRAK